MDGSGRPPGIVGMNIRLTASFLAFLSASAVWACTTTTENASNGGAGASSSSSSSGAGDPLADPSICTKTCEDKLVACKVPPADAERGCESFCASSPTTKELACVDGATCNDLLSAGSLDALCGGTSSSSSGGSSSGGSSSGGSSSGGSSSGGTSKPTSMKITAKVGNAKATHILSSDEKKIISAISIGGPPSFSPSKPSELPNVTKPKSFSVSSPSLGECKPNVAFTLNGSQVAVTVTATDVLPDADCAKWTDAIASSGLEVSLDDVPYPNGGTADVDIDFSP
jgi:hypothetical protein